MKSNVGVLSFETAGLMSKLLHLWQSLSDKNIIRLRNESISLEGVRKIVSNDESFLLGLACGEMAENLRFVAKAVSRLSKRCGDSNLSRFERLFDDFANSGRDTNCWVLNYKEMEAKNKKTGHGYPTSLPRSLSASATIHPTENHGTCSFVSGSLKSSKLEGNKDFANGFFETNSKLLKPPETTLGAAAFALHYANLIIVMEKMIRSPQLVGVDARDDLYSMLPNSIRSLLRARLKGVGFSASDPVLAGEWKDALGGYWNGCHL
ncbi:hypothetical protein GH714_026580 [Hevea brasiliensis]|uniref:DUF668 domain-containing protein n=1 Tax=Hevea brasiliensis TaxID=3981 RepID=A0A6A6MH94_HEVBR|nr:hypothetical protein GH714_026580 [Hevea brasiliensis]